jgi:3-phosphoshikimate 1-carboxyvinyltransferase
MSAHGVQFSQDHLPLHATGSLSGGVYEIEGNISSQFLSGLLMALAFLDSDSEIRLTTALQSSKYVDMTLDTLREFGADIQTVTDNKLLRYYIKSTKNRGIPSVLPVDGDWSNVAFWLTAGAIQPSGAIQVLGLDPQSVQGDKEIARILKDSGADLKYSDDSSRTTIVSCGTLNEFDVSMEEIPDLLPILAVRAAVGNGVSHFTNAARLRLKESDRLTATAEMLRTLGAKVDELPDGLTVYGGQLCGGTVDAKNDHRLVMSAAIAALRCSDPVKILGAEAVNKSYPSFFDDYQALGGCIDIAG